jgi:dihydroorotate dehydrogenase
MRRLTNDWYQDLVRPLLFRLNPETAHDFAMRLLRSAPQIPGALALLRSFAPPPQPCMLFGLQFRNRIGLAAGFDKNGVAIPAWEALGFGFVEIGTVTAKAQPGNPRPRVFRYPKEEALINRLGFNNDGADVVAERLRRLRESTLAPSIPIGINLGKSKVTPLENAAADYLDSFQRLAPVSDYIVLNVSSPNTPGLRTLQEHNALVELLRVIADANTRLSSPKPVLLKIAPDLSEEPLEEIVSVCERFDLAGIIATNTTLNHAALSGRDEAGGLSGIPLRERSTIVIRLLRSRTRLPIIGVGGIRDAVSAREKLEAGAELLQIYSGYIFRGPGLLREISASISEPGGRAARVHRT